MALYPVRFRIANGGYAAGEVAGFKLKTAQHLVKERVADFYKERSDSEEEKASTGSSAESTSSKSSSSSRKKTSKKREKELSGGKTQGYITK